MADLVFAFDAALDRPIPVPKHAPDDVAAAVAAAPNAAFRAAVATARQTRAAALVLFGNTLDPVRCSPAQAAALRGQIDALAADGCRTIWIADEPADVANVARALAEPAGLSFVTPVSPLRLDLRGLALELCSARGHAHAAGHLAPSFASAHSSLLPAQRRIVVGWDDAWTSLHGEPAVSHALPSPLPVAGRVGHGTMFVWGSRRLQPVPPGVHHVPPLQARSDREPAAGACIAATLTQPPPHAAAFSTAAHSLSDPRHEWRGDWKEFPTHHVAWRTLSITSLSGDDEELATTIWSALEGLSVDARAPLQIVRCAIDCGGSISRRVHIAEITAETMARVRELAQPRGFRAWCHEIEADRGEAPESLIRNASAAKAGGAASFAAGVAELVLDLEGKEASAVPREAGWLALELLEST
ncbi:MAG: hypothetical protein EBS56_08280 [Planctomycetia bacterium]|nr:hypothetical protein [Planctomycetia bacterium]